MRQKMSGPSVELSFYCLIINNLTPSPFFWYFYYPRKLRVSALIGREKRARREVDFITAE
jgi:hypothetical protein